MNKERINEWLVACEDSPEQQCDGALAKAWDGEKPKMHCILGMACEVFRRNNPDRARWERYKNYIAFVIDGRRIYSDTPRPVDDWFGVTELDHILAPYASRTLVMLNDEKGLSFREIAKEIRTVLNISRQEVVS